MVSAFNQAYWVAGSITGVLAGRFIPINTEGIDFSLTALFVTVAVDQWIESKKHWPAFITYLSSLLPYAVMAMLVVYCLRNISFASAGNFVPELICVILVAVLHVWKRNTILSIVTGTVCYMLLVQLVF